MQEPEDESTTLEEIARIFQVPLHLVGGDEQSNYALLKQEWERLHVGLRRIGVDIDATLDID